MRNVAERARFEELDAGEHEQEGDARIATQEDAVRLADRERDCDRKQRERPGWNARRCRQGPLPVPTQQQQTQRDERHSEYRDPDRQMHGLRELHREEQQSEPVNLSRRQQARRTRAHPKSAENARPVHHARSG